MVNLSLVLKHISSHNPQEKKYNNGKDLNVTEKLQSVITTVIIIIAITFFLRGISYVEVLMHPLFTKTLWKQSRLPYLYFIDEEIEGLRA